MNSIETKNLSVGYDNRLVVDSLNIKIPKGKITVIIGANGCGKSTLLKSLGRLLKPQKGKIYLNDVELASLKTIEVAKQMAILPQSPTAPSGLTVGELVAYGRYAHNQRKITEEDRGVISWALKMTKLESLEMSELDNLSGGQRQRAWIAMAIAQKTDTILLDEPTTYLDMSYQLEVLELLNKLNKEEDYTIIMVLHDLNLAARYADYMIAMKEGKVIASGAPDIVMQPDVLKKTFQIDADIGEDAKTGKPICLSYDLI